VTEVEWKEIEGLGSCYLVSSSGELISLKQGKTRPLRTCLNHAGYLRVNIRKDGRNTHHFVHRLVAKAFCQGYEEGLTVNHIDENKTNNHASNLEWMTIGDNVEYSSTRNCLGWIVTLPDLDEVEVLNLTKFCADNELCQGAMSRVAKGERPYHKDYKVRRNIK